MRALPKPTVDYILDNGKVYEKKHTQRMKDIECKSKSKRINVNATEDKKHFTLLGGPNLITEKCALNTKKSSQLKENERTEPNK